ncbi:MAG: ABC transporter ATP-binding protein [Deltaproteobacteria bacterium]|nr:ABC transporter ATP-binding protein [Deltaproteobacteria bacterium]
MTEERYGVRMGQWSKTLLFIVRRGNRRRFLNCIILGLLANGFVSAANPLALKYLFDEGIIRGDFGRFVTISFAIVAIFTLWRVGIFLYRIYAQRLKNEVFSDLSLGMLGKFYQIPYGEVIKRDRGYFLSRIYDEVVTAAPLVIDTTLMLSNMIITLVVALAIAVSISLRATLMVLVAVPVVYFMSQKYGMKIKRQSMAEKEEEAKVRGILERTVGSYKMARIFELRSKASAKVNNQINGFISAFFARFKTSTRYEMLSGIFMSYVENIAVISAGYEILTGRMSFGGFMGFMSAFWAVMGAVRGVFGLVPDLSRASGMVERLKEFEELDVDLSCLRYSDTVKLDRVSFGFNGKSVLADFDFAPKEGERILIVGPNGCGKSTLAHLIAGLLQPTSGVTTTYPLERISAVIVPYDFVPGTVRDNLGFAGPKQREQFQRLSRELGLIDSLDKDPSELSAGQRKRLEILMVLLKAADLYIIDEPLAGIDVGSKATVMKAILEFTNGKTLIVIMHGDSEFYEHFDRVIDLAQIETGIPAAAEGHDASQSSPTTTLSGA